jgi:hypothetical protein
MNVRLSYGAELSEVPSKIAEMLENPDRTLSKSGNKLDLIVDLLHESNGKYTATAVEMLDELRQSLATADQQLMEAQQILEGYVKATAPPEPAPAPIPQPTPPPQAKRLKDIPRGKDAVTYSGSSPIDEMIAAAAMATGELPTLEDDDV